METNFRSRFRNAWNAFFNRDPTDAYSSDIGSSQYYRPDRTRLSMGNDRSIITPVFNQIALDVANIDIRHVRLDEDGRFTEIIGSGLDHCLSVESNIDQTARAFIKDVVLTMFDKGSAAIVLVDTSVDPRKTESYAVKSVRCGEIVEWYPQHVKVRLYNDRTGQKEDILVEKRLTAIVENPFYPVTNEPNSTLKRLIRKLNLLDTVDEQNCSGKIDLIIQLPYTINTELKRKQAEDRRRDIENQLASSKYGVVYTDGSEHVTQLNRSVENTLKAQVEYLMSMLYNQLGFSQSILDGTADEHTMLNYYTRTVEPILSAITEEIERKFLSPTARTQGQAIRFFRNPFKLVPVNMVAEMADKLTRNEIMSTNEVRQILGMKPSNDPKADELRNKNLPSPNPAETEESNQKTKEDEIQNEQAV